MNKQLLITIVVIGIIILGTVLILNNNQGKDDLVLGAMGGNPTSIGAATTSTAVTVTSSTRVLATTTNALGDGSSYTRVFASICNPSATVVYLNMNHDKLASVSASQAQIAAAAGYNSCYYITDTALYQGSVQASSTNQTSTSIIVTDYVIQ